MKPTHHHIAVRAYFLWEKDGRPEGCDLEYWLTAEAELHHEWHRILPRFRPTWPTATDLAG